MIEAISHLSALPHSVGRTYQLADPNPLTVSELLDVLGEATGKRLRRVRVPRETARWAIDRVPGVRRLTGHTVSDDRLLRSPHTLHRVARAARTSTGAESTVPAFASYAERLVRYMREHPKVGSAPMV